jgi:hypothetical protein
MSLGLGGYDPLCCLNFVTHEISQQKYLMFRRYMTFINLVHIETKPILLHIFEGKKNPKKLKQ